MDVLAAGFFVDFNQPVQDDVRIVGGEVTISNSVGGDVVVLGGSVDILSTAEVAGDVVVYGGTVTIAGSVAGDVVGIMDTLVIDGPVGGEVDVTVTQLSLGDQASVAQDVQYTSHTLVEQSLNASVGGDVVRSDPLALQDSNVVKTSLILFLIALFTTLVWHLVSRKTLQHVVQQTNENLLRSAFIGFLAPVVFLVVITVLFVSQLGIYVATVGLFGFVTLTLLAGAAAPAVVGNLLMRAVQHSSFDGPLQIVVGVLVLTVCMFIPVVGSILVVAAVVLTLGGLLESVFKATR
jgi:hypothetical protein